MVLRYLTKTYMKHPSNEIEVSHISHHITLYFRDAVTENLNCQLWTVNIQTE